MADKQEASAGLPPQASDTASEEQKALEVFREANIHLARLVISPKPNPNLLDRAQLQADKAGFNLIEARHGQQPPNNPLQTP